MTAKTEKATRKSAYVGVSVRSSRKEGYVFRVFPKTRRWELLKNRWSLEKGNDKAVKGMKKNNQLQISAKSDTIVGKVNGKSHDRVQGSGDRRGRRHRHRARLRDQQKVKKKKAVAFFDKLKVSVPKP